MAGHFRRAGVHSDEVVFAVVRGRLFGAQDGFRGKRAEDNELAHKELIPRQGRDRKAESPSTQSKYPSTAQNNVPVVAKARKLVISTLFSSGRCRTDW